MLKEGHPKDGYKLSLLPPGDDSPASDYAYQHKHSNGPVYCRVLLQRGRYEVVETTHEDLPSGSLWVIHRHYKTGLDLYGQNGSGEWEPVQTLDDLARVCDVPPTVQGLRAASKARRIRPEYTAGVNWGINPHAKREE